MLLLSMAFAGGSWTDDFSDNDISDWTSLDGTWTVSGGVMQGCSDSHTGPDIIIDPGMDEGVTEYTITASMAATQTMGLTIDYGNSSLNCGYFHWAGSAMYKTNPSTIETSFSTQSWSRTSGTTYYDVQVDVDKVNETVDIYLNSALVHSGDICNGYLNSYTSTGEIGIGVHSSCSYTTYVDEISVEWEYVDNDGDGYTEDDNDCDDDDSTVNPGATEVYYDGVDQNCDGASDYDADEDGDDSDAYGGTDCDDNDAAQYLGADEYCNSEDDDCDGTVDEDDALDADTWYADTDDDGYGDSSSTDVECDQPSGYVADDTDCDDADDTVYPSATELCDGLDNDCSGLPLFVENDDDGDGWVECTLDTDGWDGDAINGGDDCDDSNSDTYPTASEICDREDNDCDGAVPTTETDDDLDGLSECEGDCDDTDAASFPGATEVAYDGIDQDCNGDDVCDVDGDGYDANEGACSGDDCDDANADINPGANEIFYDGIDQDCAEDSDYDSDGDGFDSATYGGEDCNDADPDTYPGAPDEPGDGIVTDCDAADEYDADGDGFDGEEFGGTDCDDANSDINPGADEVWYDGIDDDCDGNDDDQDNDGYAIGDDCDDEDASIFSDCLDTGEDSVPGTSAKGGGGCGCDGGGGIPTLLLVGLMGLMVRRRR
jgi:hypothetical protein